MIPDHITIGDKYGPAMLISTQLDADRYLSQCVEHCVRISGKTKAEAESIERQNIGYYAGYCSNETRKRVEHLFRCQHPIFGSISETGPPTPKMAFKAGQVTATNGVKAAAAMFKSTTKRTNKQ